MSQELEFSKRKLEDQLGRPVDHVAPPYGAVNAEVIEAVSRQYRTSVGTHLASAGATDSLLDLPRIEMWYFRDLRLWNRFLAGRADGFLARRRILRGINRFRRALAS